MASPIAHSLAGAAVYWASLKSPTPLDEWRQHARPLALFAILANLPDLDFIPGWLLKGNPNAYHHGWTHSFVFVTAAALLISWVIKFRATKAANRTWFLAATGSHLLIDYFTGPALGRIASYGMPLLWPFSETRFSSPVSLVVGPEHHDLQHLFGWHNWLWAAYEALVFGGLFLLVTRWKSAKWPSAARSR